MKSVKATRVKLWKAHKSLNITYDIIILVI